MEEQPSSLVTFYKGWENYQQALVASIAPLSPEQLARPVAPHYLSIEGLLAHMIDARVSWFSGWMGEENAEMVHWRERWNSGRPAVHEAAELVAMIEKTWHVISSALARWTSTDLDQLIPPPASHQAWLQSQGLEEEPAHTRQWIIWHVLEHEIHHGGQVSLALGTHGLEDFYTW
jgi:uncharacterized damage-inducible protein DinB